MNRLLEQIESGSFNLTEMFTKDKEGFIEAKSFILRIIPKFQKDTCNSLLVTKIFPAIFQKDVDAEVRQHLLEIGFSLLPRASLSILSSEELESIFITIEDTYRKFIGELRDRNDPNWSKLWIFLVKFCGERLHTKMTLSNNLLRVVEHAFRNSTSIEQRLKAYDCWIELIDNSSLNKSHICSPKQIKLLMTPMKAKFSRMAPVIVKRCDTFIYLLEKLQENATLCLREFLEFGFGPFNNFESIDRIRQGSTVSEVCYRSTKVLMEIIGHSHNDKESCLQTSDILLYKPLITSSNFPEFAEILINSVVYCCVLNRISRESECNNVVVGCLWRSILKFVQNSNTKLQEQCCSQINQLLWKLLQKSRNIHQLYAILCSIVLRLSHENLKEEFAKAILDAPLIFLCQVDTSESSRLSSQQLFQFIDSCLEPQSDGSTEDFQDNFKNKNFTALGEIWLKCDFKLTHDNIFYMLLPISHPKNFTDEDALRTKWARVYGECANDDVKVLVMQRMENIFLENPLLSLIVVNFVELISSVENNPSKHLISNFIKLIDCILTLPNLPESNLKKLSSIILKYCDANFDFYKDPDNKQPIDKLCGCVDHIVKIHKDYGILTKLTGCLQDTKPEVLDKFCKALTPCLEELMLNEDMSICNSARELIQLLETKDRKSGNVSQRSGRSLRIVNMAATSTRRSKETKKPIKSPKGVFVINDERSADYVKVDTTVKVVLENLNEHQKEVLQRRREDIPALYQDLSQSRSQDFFKHPNDNSNSVDNSDTIDEKSPNKRLRSRSRAKTPTLVHVAKEENSEQANNDTKHNHENMKLRDRKASTNHKNGDAIPKSNDARQETSKDNSKHDLNQTNNNTNQTGNVNNDSEQEIIAQGSFSEQSGKSPVDASAKKRLSGEKSIRKNSFKNETALKKFLIHAEKKRLESFAQEEETKQMIQTSTPKSAEVVAENRCKKTRQATKSSSLVSLNESKEAVSVQVPVTISNESRNQLKEDIVKLQDKLEDGSIKNKLEEGSVKDDLDSEGANQNTMVTTDQSKSLKDVYEFCEENNAAPPMSKAKRKVKRALAISARDYRYKRKRKSCKINKLSQTSVAPPLEESIKKTSRVKQNIQNTPSSQDIIESSQPGVETVVTRSGKRKELRETSAETASEVNCKSPASKSPKRQIIQDSGADSVALKSAKRQLLQETEPNVIKSAPTQDNGAEVASEDMFPTKIDSKEPSSPTVFLKRLSPKITVGETVKLIESLPETLTCDVSKIQAADAQPEPEISGQDDLPSSPITCNTPDRNQELLNNTCDISPINAAPDDEGDRTPRQQTNEVKNLRVVRLLQMVNSNVPVSNKGRTWFGSKNGSPAVNLSKRFRATREENLDILTFSREVPSPLLVPASSILKRKLSSVEETSTPSPKRKRVNFSDPAISEKKLFIKYSEEYDDSDQNSDSASVTNPTGEVPVKEDSNEILKSVNIGNLLLGFKEHSALDGDEEDKKMDAKRLLQTLTASQVAEVLHDYLLEADSDTFNEFSNRVFKAPEIVDKCVGSLFEDASLETVLPKITQALQTLPQHKKIVTDELYKLSEQLGIISAEKIQDHVNAFDAEKLLEMVQTYASNLPQDKREEFLFSVLRLVSGELPSTKQSLTKQFNILQNFVNKMNE